MTSSSLRISPDILTFRDVNVGDSEIGIIHVLNTGNEPIKIRFTLPIKSPFKLLKEGLFNIPAGLEVIEKVKYNCNEFGKIEDAITIETSTGPINVPIIAYPPAPRILVDKNKIEIPNVSMNSERTFQFKITNSGVVDVNFSLKFDEPSIQLTPSNGTIGTADTLTIHGMFKPTTVGTFNTSIQIECEDIMEPPKPIQFKANSINNSLQFTFNEQPVKLLDFKTAYFGQKRVLTTTLINDTQQRKSFIILPPQDSSFAKTLSAKSIVFIPEPSEGSIDPYGQLPISFTFAPRSNEIDSDQDDFETEFTHYSAIEVVETSQRIDFQLTGRAYHHRISVPVVDLVFGDQLTNSKTVQSIDINNHSQYLPTTFEIREIANYRFHPSKGTIQPGKSQKVEISFIPKGLGILDASTYINFCKGQEKKTLNLYGTCVSTLDNKPFVREPITARDSTARFNYNHPDLRYQHPLEKTKKIEENNRQYNAYISKTARTNKDKKEMAEFLTQTRKMAETMFLDEEGQINQGEVDKYIQTRLRQRESKDDQLNLGFTKGEGLTPNDPPLLKRPENYLSDKMGTSKLSKNDDAQNAFIFRKAPADENILIKKKFKSKPSTPNEINDCAKVLTPAQQLMIDISHQSLDFGEMSVNSTATKSFNIANNLQQFILVTMNYTSDELQQSTPISQVIPPKQAAGFDIKFNAFKPQNFHKTIKYTINSTHEFVLSINATVVPIDLQLSRNTIEFRFGSGTSSPFLKEFVTIQNKSDSDARFQWESNNPQFTLSTLTGQIEKRKSQNVEITYIPGQRSRDEAVLTMKVEGGPSKTLKCIGYLGSPKCTLLRKKVEFGLVPVGISKTEKFKIKNSAQDDAIFSITNPNLTELQIVPSSGKISGHDTKTFEITFKSMQAHSFDYNIAFEIAGAPSLHFNVTGQSELPNVNMTCSEFDFGRVFVGSKTSIKASLINVGSIPAILFLNLFSKPEFGIEYSSELSDNNSKGNSISLVADPCFITTGFDESISMDIKPPANDESEDKAPRKNRKSSDADHASNHKNANGLIYKIILKENTSIDFNFTYQPTEVNEHNFEFPLTLLSVPTSSIFHLQPIVSAESINAPLRVSTNDLDFGISSIFDPTNPHLRCSANVFKIYNEHRNTQQWKIECGDNPNFIIEPRHGSLEFGQNISVHVTFTPRNSGLFCMNLPIYGQTEKDGNVLISTVKLTGVGTPMKLKLSHKDVYLPIVPLNVKSQMMIYILNFAYIESNLKVEMLFDKKVCPVEITFPQGSKLTPTISELPVLISFQSSQPISFSTMFAIVDQNGNAVSFNLSCTADNSLFTIYPFLADLPNIKIDASEGGKPIMLNTKGLSGNYTSKMDLSQALSFTDLIDLKIKDIDNSADKLQEIIDFTLRYLNSLVLNTQINEFPADLIRNDGALLLEIVNNLSGGSKKSFDSFTDKDKVINDDPVLNRKESMKKILHTIQSMGGLLSSVKPEFLLSRSDFITIAKAKTVKQLLGIDYFNGPEIKDLDQSVLSEFTSSRFYSNSLMARVKVLESIYSSVSVKSWLIVVMQLLKLFVINKIDVNKLNSVPGVSDTIKALKTYSNQSLISDVNRSIKSLSSSNIFSSSECALLKWVSLYVSKDHNELMKPIIDFKSLSNSKGFQSLINQHTGRFLIFNSDDDDKEVDEQNAVEIIEALRNLKLSFIPKAQDIFKGNRIILAILTSYLYEMLPHFFPKTTVEFQTKLHKVDTRSITISNPSKVEITYNASISGSDCFNLPKETITIPPSSNCEFPIEFLARTVKPISAKLELVPSRPRIVSNSNFNSTMMSTTSISAVSRAPVFSAPIVINLETKVEFEKPDGFFQIEGQLYQPTLMTLPIKNILNVPAKLTVKSYFSQLINEYDKNVENLPISQIVNKLISGESIDNNEEIDPNDTAFSTYLKRHQTFIVRDEEIEFTSTQNTKDIEIEFIPIGLGTFRLILLFTDEIQGEFVIEVKGKSLLPSPIDAPLVNKLKSQCGQKSTATFSIDPINMNLVNAVAYSIERHEMMTFYKSERKFKDLITRRLREVDTAYRQSLSTEKYRVFNSAQSYFDMSGEIQLSKINITEGKQLNKNELTFTFKPTKAGKYPCHIVLISKNDVRNFQLTGTGIEATKTVSMEFVSLAGRALKQEVPIQNSSDEEWTYKVSVTGDNCFTAPQKLIAKPKSITNLPIQFLPYKIGQFSGQLQLFNINKESTIVYTLNGTAEEPPAEAKIVLDCQARRKLRHKIELKPLITNGVIHVTSNIPIISFNKEISITSENAHNRTFEFTVLAQRSGVSAGTLTFTDPVTKSYMWYVIEIHVDSPDPEETIEVKTVARKSSTVTIPISNPSSEKVHFTVVFSDDDMFGEKEFSIDPNESYDYKLIISPLKALKRFSSIYFLNDADGEFWFSLKIESTEPPERNLASLSSPIGKSASTFVLLENPLTDKSVSYRYENSNQTSFLVISKKRMISVGPGEKKRVEIKFVPSTVGIKESAAISFISSDTGEYVYHLSGTGKPPQPLSPVIVSCPTDSVNSALVTFNNPFPYPGRFSVSMDSTDDVFQFLNKRKVFTLNKYDEEYQIPFSFAPKEIGQYKRFIIVASLGPSNAPLPELEAMPNVRWVYPIIGNSVSDVHNEVKSIRTKSMTSFEETMNFTLVGENEVFDVADYCLSMQFPAGYEFLRYSFDLRAEKVDRSNNTTQLLVFVRFTPQKPLHVISTLKVRNSLSQEWSFDIDLAVERGKPLATVSIESTLNKQGFTTVTVPMTFRHETPFTAYFMPGSATELDVTPKTGIIQPAYVAPVQLPIQVLFMPKMYGKVLKGTLAVDTPEAQYLFDIIGKTPEYVPPDVSNMSNRINNRLPDEVQRFHKMQTKKHRNIIRDNIENVKFNRKPNMTTKNSYILNSTSND